MTVAAGFAARHGIATAEFLRRIAPQMTHAEKQRAQVSTASTATSLAIDLAKTPLTKLALFVLGLPLEERRQRAAELHDALSRAADLAVRKFPLSLGKVAMVLDRSRSTWGTAEKRRRPLGVAVAVDYFVRAASQQTQAFWTPAARENAQPNGLSDEELTRYPFFHQASGQTDLSTPLLQAIQWLPQQIIIVSDGYENSPPGTVQQIVAAYRSKLTAHHAIAFVHANPVFDADHFSPRRLGTSLVTLGLRDAEDLGPALGFARFAAGDASQKELEDYLGQLVVRYGGQV